MYHILFFTKTLRYKYKNVKNFWLHILACACQATRWNKPFKYIWIHWISLAFKSLVGFNVLMLHIIHLIAAYIWCVCTCHPLTVWRCRCARKHHLSLTPPPSNTCGIQIDNQPYTDTKTQRRTETQTHSMCTSGYSSKADLGQGAAGSWVSACTCFESWLSSVKLLLSRRWQCIQIPSTQRGKVPSNTIPACATTSWSRHL